MSVHCYIGFKNGRLQREKEVINKTEIIEKQGLEIGDGVKDFLFCYF